MKFTPFALISFSSSSFSSISLPLQESLDLGFPTPKNARTSLRSSHPQATKLFILLNSRKLLSPIPNSMQIYLILLGIPLSYALFSLGISLGAVDLTIGEILEVLLCYLRSFFPNQASRHVQISFDFLLLCLD